MSAAGPASGVHADEALPVAPVLVRDYRRLVRLFPYSYRREHEAEMLGHLLDGARPEQSRPSGAERRDLVLAAVREWLLAPLGSTARERRAATGLLFVLLPAVLVVPAARSVAYASWLAGSELGPPVLSSVPMLGTWVVWGAGAVALLAGPARTGRLLIAAAAAVGTVTLAVLVATGDERTAYFESGWVIGLAAHALVVLEHDRCRLSGPGRRRVVGALGTALAALGAYVAAVHGVRGGASWWAPAGGHLVSVGAAAVPIVAALGVMLLWARTRQGAPVLLGVVVGIALGRSDLFWSGNRTVGTEDLGNVLALLACALAATIAARWCVNRLDELAEARAAHRERLGAPT
ncbi:hypothetical protein [Oerskovia sp. USHLN155]|uniref:hypothetical protein n=1 Tax=Oerskovia sp. USHLN155 TaxID=3081288 RepID=UPI00301B5AFE